MRTWLIAMALAVTGCAGDPTVEGQPCPNSLGSPVNSGSLCSCAGSTTLGQYQCNVNDYSKPGVCVGCPAVDAGFDAGTYDAGRPDAGRSDAGH